VYEYIKVNRFCIAFSLQALKLIIGFEKVKDILQKYSFKAQYRYISLLSGAVIYDVYLTGPQSVLKMSDVKR